MQVHHTFRAITNCPVYDVPLTQLVATDRHKKERLYWRAGISSQAVTYDHTPKPKQCWRKAPQHRRVSYAHALSTA